MPLGTRMRVGGKVGGPHTVSGRGCLKWEGLAAGGKGDGWEETHSNQVLCSHQGNCHEYWESGSKSLRPGGQDPG